MRNARRRGVMTVVMALALAALVGCGVTIPEEESPTLLRTYQVPADYQDELQRMLQSAMNHGGEAPIGRVTAGPRGTLLVVAPQRIHRGVEQILEGDFEPPAPAVPVTIDYWLLVGRPLEGGAEGEFSMVGGPAPQLAPVLTQITASQGPTEFALLEQVSLTAIEQERATASGSSAQFEQRVTRADDDLVANIQIINRGSNSITTRIALDRDQFVVLGQVGYAGGQRLFAEQRDSEVQTLFYVLRADF